MYEKSFYDIIFIVGIYAKVQYIFWQHDFRRWLTCPHKCMYHVISDVIKKPSK